MRPTIIESALGRPRPGWLEGIKVADPLILAYAARGLTHCPARLNRIDIVPVDHVAHACVAAAAHPSAGALRTIAIASSARNPLAIGELAVHIREYFRRNPLPGRDGKPIAIGELQFVDRRVALRKTVRREQLAPGLARLAIASPVHIPQDACRAATASGAERVTRMVKIYGAYTELDCVFDDANARALAPPCTRPTAPSCPSTRRRSSGRTTCSGSTCPRSQSLPRANEEVPGWSSPELRAGSAPPRRGRWPARATSSSSAPAGWSGSEALAAEIGARRSPSTSPTRPRRGLRRAASRAATCWSTTPAARSGSNRVAEADEERWRWMYEANVLGTMRMTRALLPALTAPATGTSSASAQIAGFETYRGGAGYTAAKHALRAIARTLRLELLGEPVRVTEIAPGMVETEFSLVRFAGDEEAARPRCTRACRR